jgi:hypothetical protein
LNVILCSNNIKTYSMKTNYLIPQARVIITLFLCLDFCNPLRSQNALDKPKMNFSFLNFKLDNYPLLTPSIDIVNNHLTYNYQINLNLPHFKDKPLFNSFKLGREFSINAYPTFSIVNSKYSFNSLNKTHLISNNLFYSLLKN